MTTQIRMPAFSATMETGRLINWLVEEGASIEKGDVIAEIETDKAVAEIESPVSGIVQKILVPAGDDDIDVEVPLIEISTDVSGGPEAAMETEPESSAIPEAVADDCGNRPNSPQPKSTGPRIAAAPSARKIAKDAGVDLAELIGSGPNGRITNQDVLDHLRKNDPGKKATDAKTQALRIAIARAMVQSKTTVPHFYTETDIVIDELIRLKQEIGSSNPDVKISLTALLVMGVARAHGDVPEASLRWEDGSIVHKDSCDIGVAVDVGSGVIAPVIRNVETMDVVQVAVQLKELSAQARAGTIKQSDLGDASLTISNLGMFSIDRFYPIINIPEPMIVGVGRARRSAVVVGDEVKIRSVLTVTLSVDHRVIDGAIAGRFADALKQHLEQPSTIAFLGDRQ
jgi:pyruvate dehydrogenase E2 component (dihydrolipoamide acetyltransferase)